MEKQNYRYINNVQLSGLCAGFNQLNNPKFKVLNLINSNGHRDRICVPADFDEVQFGDAYTVLCDAKIGIYQDKIQISYFLAKEQRGSI